MTFTVCVNCGHHHPGDPTTDRHTCRPSEQGEPPQQPRLFGHLPPSTWAQAAKPLTVGDHIRLWPPLHELWCLLQLTPIRDRLRCPQCKAVGTWKPHGSRYDRWRHNDRPARRWLCKWCGHYTGPEGVVKAFMDPKRSCWVLPREFDPESPAEPLKTPMEVLREHMGRTWPWIG